MMPRLLLSLLLVLGMCAGSLPAAAQIAHERPGQLKAANRRALREARRSQLPYQASHLQVTREQLRRGSSPGPLPAETELQHLQEAELPATTPTPGAKSARRKKYQ